MPSIFSPQLQEHVATPSNEAKYYPPEIIVLVTPNVSPSTRGALYPAFCSRLVDIDHIPSPTSNFDEHTHKDKNTGQKTEPVKKTPKTSHVAAWDEHCGLSKLQIFSLEVYGTILYIDADCLVLQDLTHLLEMGRRRHRETSCALLAAAPDIFPPDKFNAGVLLIHPSALVYEDMMERGLRTLDSYDGGDTGFLNAYFPNWYAQFPSESRLPFGYNAQRCLYRWTYTKQPRYWDLGVKGTNGDGLFILHFSSSPKPWDMLHQTHQQTASTTGTTTLSHLLQNNDIAALDQAKQPQNDQLEQLWWQYHNKALAQEVAFRTDRKKAEHQQNQTSPSNTQPLRHKKQGNGEPAHRLVSRRFKELRKLGMDTKDAMATAQAEYGSTDENDPSARVAAMFGIAP